MRRTSGSLGVILMLGILLIAADAFAGDFTHSVVGVGGYDVVAYQTMGKAVRGTGFHAAEYNGVTYLFASKEDRAKFLKNPALYLPQFGGFCAYGASVGKKIYADPTVWKLVNGKLYLNVDANIQKKFERDLAGNIAKAEANWPKLVDKMPVGL